jgi:putative transposase
VPGRLRFDATGIVCHVLNRSAKRQPLFTHDAAYRQCLGVLREAVIRYPVRLLAYCLMPNHWHLVLWPEGTDLPRFAHWLTVTHVGRWHRLHESTGQGAVYQGPYKALPVQTEPYFYTLVRYVERNPVRAGLVERAADWPWSSAARHPGVADIPLADWPVPRPADWTTRLDKPDTAAELRELRGRLRHSVPLGDPVWSRRFTTPVRPRSR